MGIILWLLGVPLSVVLLLMLFGVLYKAAAYPQKRGLGIPCQGLFFA